MVMEHGLTWLFEQEQISLNLHDHRHSDHRLMGVEIVASRRSVEAWADHVHRLELVLVVASACFPSVLPSFSSSPPISCFLVLVSRSSHASPDSAW